LEEISASGRDLAIDPTMFDVYPNPSAEQVEFLWQSGYAGMPGQFKILDRRGRTVYQAEQLPGVLQLDFLPAGLYILEAIAGQTRSVKTIVKK